MKVTELTIAAGRTFNHPFENYSNLKPSVVLHATLADGDDVEQCVKELQGQAEMLVETHKQILLNELKRRNDIEQATLRASHLKRAIHDANQELEQLKERHGDMLALLPEAQQDELPL